MVKILLKMFWKSFMKVFSFKFVEFMNQLVVNTYGFLSVFFEKF